MKFYQHKNMTEKILILIPPAAFITNQIQATDLIRQVLDKKKYTFDQ